MSNEPTAPGRLNVFYKLTIVAGGAFAVTILAVTATMFGPPVSPAARFVIRFSGVMLAVEVVLTLLFGLLALAADRREMTAPAENASSSAGDPESS